MIIHKSDKKDNFDTIFPSLKTLFLENDLLGLGVSDLAIKKYMVDSLFMILF